MSERSGPEWIPVEEAGGGEAEGFELAEHQLIENAEHRGSGSLVDPLSPEAESDLAGAEYGEADAEHKPDS